MLLYSLSYLRLCLPVYTVQKQARLVELLDVYPDEEVAAQRWEKISKALGTRTPKQVASRVQKYFIKLAKANLPVPGRMPNTVTVCLPAPRWRARSLFASVAGF